MTLTQEQIDKERSQLNNRKFMRTANVVSPGIEYALLDMAETVLKIRAYCESNSHLCDWDDTARVWTRKTCERILAIIEGKENAHE